MTFRDLVAVYLGRRKLHADNLHGRAMLYKLIADLGLPEPKSKSKVPPLSDIVDMIDEVYNVASDHGLWVDLSDQIRDEEGNHIDRKMYGNIVLDAQISNYMK